MQEETVKWTNCFFRPKTRGELRESLKNGIKCEVVATNEEITTIMLNSLNILKTNNYTVEFKTSPSPNEGWVIYEKIN